MKKSCKKLFCIILSLFTLFSALPLTVHAAITVIDVDTSEDLTAACEEINNGSGGEYTIKLTDDITGGNIAITNSNAVVTVVGNGHTLHVQSQYVQVEKGATVNLGDGKSELIIQSENQTYDTPGLVYVLKDSFCNMYDKVTLKDHKGNNYFGGGVTIEGGTFHMYGGTITNCGISGGTQCFGGGVAVFAGGSFIMEEGSVISDCYVEDGLDFNPSNNLYSTIGGGVFVTEGSTFTMNGGRITGCESTNFGGGVAMAITDTPHAQDEFGRFGIGNPQSIVTINGGTITGNKAKIGAGVFASGFYTAYATAIYEYPPESGTASNPGLFINGGEISSNEAEDAGGGVLVAMIKSNAQIHNAEIKNNTANTGAGIENLRYNTQLDIYGCTITGNAAASNGGGIAAILNSGQGKVGYTKIQDTTITGNTSGDRGAGVYYDANSEIRLSGANKIQDNTYNGKLNNLNVLSLEKPVTVVGNLTGSQIGLSDPTLWDDGKEDTAADAISTERLTNGYKTNNASLIPANAFTSDHESWYVDFGEVKTEQVETGRTYTYTARMYDAVSRSTGSQAARGTLVDVVAKTTFSQGGRASNTTELYNELTTRYKEEYQEIDTNYYYDPVSGSNIEVYPYGYNIYVYVDNTTLFAGVSYQQYVEEGHFALLFLGGTLDNAEFSDDYTEETVVLDEPIDYNETEYGFNDIGHTISKTEINKSSEVVDIQYETITTDYTNEVRLVRRNPNYHINNADIANAKYDGEDIFTSSVEAATGKAVKYGETITAFYAVPEVVPTQENSCPYIFKGWYYDQDNDNDENPVVFGTDKYTKDIYAHWIKVENVAPDKEDDNILPGGDTEYGGFDLSGVQVREGVKDTNFGYEKMPGGLRFLTSLNMDVVNEINAIKPNNIEYGYVAATNKDWIDYHSHFGRKLLYVSTSANGIDTASDNVAYENYFGFAKNIKCTSEKSNTQGIVRDDHRNFGGYLLYTLVITYEGVEDSAYESKVLARPYIKYTDANGLERVAYSEYRGNANTLGGCYTSYNAIAPQASN